MSRQVFLRVGETFNLELEGNLTSGYDWEYSIDHPEILTIEKVIKTKEPSAIGNLNKILFVFTGVSKGRAGIIFLYRKSWETGVPPLEKIEFEVEVS